MEKSLSRNAMSLRPLAQNVIPTDLGQEMSQSYLEYAMSVIIGRALPDARDGLKPVHRRILYAMHELGLSADRPFRKCARVVGDVIGKYHPHGDVAVYDALVRMAQDFSMRHPLVSGHGNFGSVDNDPPAAMRYTECRLTALSQAALLQDIDANTVDFGDNYDGSQQEPLVLPSRLPQLLLNGSSGIAVGMATNIPPHHLGELVDGLLALIEQPELDSFALMRYIPAPDFPTGGILVGHEGIQEAYTTGRGSLTLRGVARIEPLGSRTAIIITELPYQTNKAAMIEKIAELVNDKKLDGIADIRDESDRQGMRVVLELKRDANPQVVLNNLYKQTPLQSTFGVNLLAIVHNERGVAEPRLLTLRDSLQIFLDFRQEVIERRTRYELGKAEERDHLLQGLLIALNHLEQVIGWVREAADTGSARELLQTALGLSPAQSEAILQMQLRRLTALEAEKIRLEHEDLVAKIADLRDILNRRERILQIIKDELQELKSRFDNPRRTQIQFQETDLDTEDLIENREIVLFLTEQGYIKRLDVEEFQVQGRATRGKSGTRMKEEDAVSQFLACRSHDTILLFSNRGVVYSLRGFEIPSASRTARGTALVQLLSLEGGEKITSVIPISEFGEDEYLVMLTEKGYIKKTVLSAFATIRSSGLIAISLEEGDHLVWVRRARESDDVLIATQQGMGIRFHADHEQLRPLGRATRGVRAMTLNPGDRPVSMDIIPADAKDGFILLTTVQGYGKLTPVEAMRAQNRGGKGVIACKLRQDDQDGCDELVALRIVHSRDEIMLVTSRGIVIRQVVQAISSQSRMGMGVRLQRLDADDRIVGVTVVPPSLEEDNDAAQGEKSEVAASVEEKEGD